MMCDWQGLLRVIPQNLRSNIDCFEKESLEEIRLRIGQPPELVFLEKSVYMDTVVTDLDLDFCINAASQYSPWSAATASKGYITAHGGHRIGICGQVIAVDGKLKTVNHCTSLCIRVAREIPGLATGLLGLCGSMLIIGNPGSGKTTLLRDLIRLKSNMESSNIAVVDERSELFPVVNRTFCFTPGKHTDILSGCGKADGIEMLIRTMRPHYVAVDEITAAADCHSILQARSCGVFVLATAHAANLKELEDRPVYKPLLDAGIFSHIIVMRPDKSWQLERTNL